MSIWRSTWIWASRSGKKTAVQTGKRMMHRTILVIIVGVFVAGAGVHAAGAKVPARAASEPLVSRPLLRSAGLQWNWEIQLPIRSGETLDRLFVFGDVVYALTDTNFLLSLDRATGRARFGLTLAEVGLPVADPLFYEDKLWFMVGGRLICVDPEQRQVVRRMTLKGIGGSAAGPIARNTDYLYVPGADGLLHVFWVDGYIEAFSVRPDNKTAVTSVVADNDLAIFASAGGNVVSIAADRNQKRWQFDLLGGVTAPIVRDGRWLYVSGRDAKVYKLDVERGRNVWLGREFYAGMALKWAPVVGREVIYQFADRQGLHAVRKESGQKAWTLENGLAVLAEAGSRAYVFQDPGLLVAMDNGTGRKIWSLNAADVTRYVVNVADAEPRIYLADDTGRLMSITAGATP